MDKIHRLGNSANCHCLNEDKAVEIKSYGQQYVLNKEAKFLPSDEAKITLCLAMSLHGNLALSCPWRS